MINLSIVIPCYNEASTILELLDKVRAVSQTAEIIIVDDFSSDGTRDILIENQLEYRYLLVLNKDNQGKGACVKTAIMNASRDYLIIQDADLEYDPADYQKLLDLCIEKEADVVYGSRFLDLSGNHFELSTHFLANKFLTTLSNFMTGYHLTDMECCYKLFRRSIIQTINIEEKRFGIEPEITAKCASLGLDIHEVPISYKGRSYSDGKKIGLLDGLRAIYCIFKYR